jgi:hypothetical protein
MNMENTGHNIELAIEYILDNIHKFVDEALFSEVVDDAYKLYGIEEDLSISFNEIVRQSSEFYDSYPLKFSPCENKFMVATDLTVTNTVFPNLALPSEQKECRCEGAAMCHYPGHCNHFRTLFSISPSPCNCRTLSGGGNTTWEVVIIVATIMFLVGVVSK